MNYKLTKENLPAIEDAFAKKVAEGKTDVIFFDEDLAGFGLRLRKGGRRGTWVCRYEYAGIQRKLTIGSTALLEPDEARKLAKKAMAYKDWFGEDPQVKKADERAKARVTLRYIATQYLRAKEREDLRPKSLREAQWYLLKAFRPLHSLPVHQISRRDIAVVLNDLAENSPAAASQARAYLSALFVWAIGEGLVESNPVAGTNNPGGTREARDRVLTNDELTQIWKACADDDAGRIVKLLILTGQRREEIGGMAWPEFDRDNGTWTLPASRSKNKQDHLVPLSRKALDILSCLPPIGKLDGFVFTHTGRRAYRNFAADKAKLQALSGTAGWTLHDLRRTARTLMTRAGVSADHAELALGHVLGGVRGVYDRHCYREEKRRAFEALANLIERITNPPAENVVTFPR